MSVTATARTRCFQGKLLCRVAASVAHDRYEKLVEIGSGPGHHPSIEAASLEAAAESRFGRFQPSNFVENLAAQIEAKGGCDPDIDAFARFYKERSKRNCAQRRAGLTSNEECVIRSSPA